MLPDRFGNTWGQFLRKLIRIGLVLLVWVAFFWLLGAWAVRQLMQNV